MTYPPDRRRFLKRAGIAAAALVAVPTVSAGALFTANQASAPPNDAPDRSGPMRSKVQTASGLTIYTFRTGFVRVKSAHREWAGPGAIRFPAIIGDLSWTEWMPIHSYLIVHPDGPILIDTGETANINDESYFDCDPGSKWFIRSNLRLDVLPEETLAAQLRDINFKPDSVLTVVMTHLHTDHVGGLESFSQARILVNRSDWPSHLGVTTCLLPTWLRPDLVQFDGPARGAFEASYQLTARGDVSIVPTPGHSPGHQSVLITDGPQHWLLGGDASFDDKQILSGARAGIVEDWESSATTLRTIARQFQDSPTIYAPAHDPNAFARLEASIPSQA